jgi:hypothetical protein
MILLLKFLVVGAGDDLPVEPLKRRITPQRRVLNGRSRKDRGE